MGRTECCGRVRWLPTLPLLDSKSRSGRWASLEFSDLRGQRPLCLGASGLQQSLTGKPAGQSEGRPIPSALVSNTPPSSVPSLPPLDCASRWHFIHLVIFSHFLETISDPEDQVEKQLHLQPSSFLVEVDLYSQGAAWSPAPG